MTEGLRETGALDGRRCVRISGYVPAIANVRLLLQPSCQRKRACVKRYFPSTNADGVELPVDFRGEIEIAESQPRDFFGAEESARWAWRVGHR